MLKVEKNNENRTSGKDGHNWRFRITKQIKLKSTSKENFDMQKIYAKQCPTKQSVRNVQFLSSSLSHRHHHPPKKIHFFNRNDARVFGAMPHHRSLKTNRLFPTANKPDPMPQNLAFLFTKITPEQMMYMWNVLTASGKGWCGCFF